MVAATTLAKYGNDNLNLYIELYTEKYGKPPVLNRHKLKWGFQDMVKDLGNAGAKQTIRYYFETGRVGHPVDQLLYNYDDLYKTSVEVEEDEKKREELRKQTEQRVRAWEEKYGNN